MIRRVSAMLLMLVWALPALAVEQAGQVIFVAGTVTVERPESTKLKKTDPVFEGDVIVTAARSRGQLLMKDGAKFSLRANTRFAVEEYFLAGEEREQPDGSVVVASDSSAVASLVKGGFRTISGAIGNDDPEQYAVKSPAATMGIRGTHYSAVLCSGDCAVPEGEPPPDGLYVGVTDGVVSISNDTGEYTVNPGEYYYVESFESTPVQLPEPPGILDEGADEAGTADEESEEESDEESTDESGEEADEEGSEDGEDSGDESAEEDAGEGSEESADGEESAAAEESAAGDESGAAADSGESTDGQAADGSAEQSATAAAEVAETADALGQTTSESVGLDSSPDAGPPGETFSSRSTAPPGESPGGTAPDTSGEGEEGAAAEEEATADSSGDAPAGEESTASTTDSGSTAGSGGSTSFGDAGAGSGSAATGGSTAPPPSEPPIPVTTEDGGTLEGGELPAGRAVALGSGPASGLSTTVFTGASNSGLREFSADDLASFQSTPTVADSTYAIGTASLRDDGFDPATGIGWGRWAGNSATVTQPDGSVISIDLGMQSLHWIYGPDSAPAVPMTGTASYSLIAGNTDPTDTLGNTGVLGDATLSANFTNLTVQSSIALAIAGRLWEASGSGAIDSNLFNGIYNSLTIGGQSAGNGNFSGFFGAPGANGLPNGAGLTYGLNDGAGVSVSGAVVFGPPDP